MLADVRQQDSKNLNAKLTKRVWAPTSRKIRRRGEEKKAKTRPAFLKKRSKKLLSVSASPDGLSPNEQTFFGSFFVTAQVVEAARLGGAKKEVFYPQITQITQIIRQPIVCICRPTH